MTVMLTANVADPPPVLVPVTVYEVAGDSTVGMPLIAPVVALRLKPAGRGGATVKDVTPPTGVMVGDRLVICTSFVNVLVDNEYVITMAITVNLTTVTAEPAPAML